MTGLSRDAAQTIISSALAYGASQDMRPLSVVVLDAGGRVQAVERSEGSSSRRRYHAHVKASSAISLVAALLPQAQREAFFFAGLNGTLGSALVPIPGGVLVRDGTGIVGAVGVTGDTADHVESAAIAGIEAAGFTALGW